MENLWIPLLSILLGPLLIMWIYHEFILKRISWGRAKELWKQVETGREAGVPAKGAEFPLFMEREMVRSGLLTPSLVEHITWRRLLFWWIAGQLFFLFLVMFLIVRAAFLGVVSPSQVWEGATTLVRWISAVTISMPLGFVLYQVFFFLYWNRLLPIQFSIPDRAYMPLKALKEDFDIDYESLFGQPLRDTSSTCKPGKPWVRLLFGSEVTLYNIRQRPQLLKWCRENWSLLNSLWLEVIPKEYIGSLDRIAGFKEDNFVLLSVSRVSLAIAFIIYAIYGARQVILQDGGLNWTMSILLNFIIGYVLFRVLNSAKNQTSHNAIDFKENHIRYALKKRLKGLAV